MLLKEIMTEQVRVISPDTPLQEAARIMDTLNVGALPICERDRLVGIVTDRDIVLRAVATGQNISTCCVKDVMTSPVTYCFEDQDLEVAADIMEEKQIRRLPILNHEMKLVGIVALGDMAVDLDDTALTAELTRRISQPGHPSA